ncbi:tape measure protein [Azospirillum palustre]
MADFPGMMVPVGADDSGLRRVLSQAEARVDQFAGRVDGSVRRAAGSFDALGSAAGRVAGVVAGIGLAQGAGEAIRAADAWSLSVSKIALYAGAGEKAVAVQEQLFQAAQRARSAMEPTVGLYTSLADAALTMGKSQGEVIRLTETISKTFKISGTEAGTAAGALVQLSQAMASGVLRGDEFNSVMEASPRLAKALAEGLGVPRGALKSLAEQGALTADKVVTALLKQSIAIDTEFGHMATTVSDSLTVLANTAQRQIGQMNQAVGLTAGISSGILVLADNLDAVTKAAGGAALALGAIAAARTMPTGIAAVTQAIDDQRVALYAKAVATAEAANAEKLAAAQDLIRAQTARVATVATVQAAEAEFAAKAAAASSAATTLASAESALTSARAKTALTTNVYVLAKALATERDAEATVVMAREASIAADAEKVASLARLRAAQLATAAAGEAVVVADAHLTTMAVSANAASVALAQRASLLTAAWNGVKAAGAGMLGVVGGPWGAALLAGAAAVAVFATRTTAAEAAADSFEHAQRAAQDAVKESAADVEQLATQYGRLSDSMRAVTRIKLDEALAEQAKAIAAQRSAASAAVYRPDSVARPVSGDWNVSTDSASSARFYERMGLAADRVDRLRVAFQAFRSAAADDPEAIANLVRVLDEVGRNAGAAGKPLLELAQRLADPATKAEAAAKTSKELAARLALLANPADEAAKAVLAAGQTADTAASRFAGLGSAVGGVASKLAELGARSWTLSLPEGLERRVGEMVGPPPEQKTPVVTGLQDRGRSSDDTAYQTWDAQRDVVRGRLKSQIVPAESAEAVRLLTLEADATEKLARARASGNPATIKAAEVEVEVAKRLREGLDPAQEGSTRTQLLRKARAELAGEVGAQVTQLTMDVAAQQRLAAAAGKGEAAQRAAAAANRVSAAGLKGYGDAAAAAEARVEALTVQQLRKDADQPIQDRIRSARALMDAYEQGPKAVRAAEVAEQAHTLALKEGEEGTQKYNEAKAHYIELLTQAQQLESAAAAGPMLQQQRDQLELGQKQLQLIGASAEMRAVELARTQALIDLRDRNIDAASREGQAYLANAEALARQNLALERTNAAYQELEQFGDRSFDAILQKLSAAGKSTMSWADAIGTVSVELQQLALKMAVINPLKNWVMGSNLPTVFDFFGGSSGQTGQTGQSGGIGGSLTNTALSKGAGWAADKLGLTGGVTNAIDSWGYSALGIGTATSTVVPGVGSAAATTAATTINPATGSLAAYNSWGAAGAQGAGSGVAAGTGLSAYLGAAGAGAMGGGIVGGALGTATNSKAVGGLSGAAAGAGAAYLASAMQLGALGGPWGIAIGAVVGAIMGMLGTQKATVGPNSSGNITLNGKGGFRTDTALADNGADAGQMQQVTDAVAASMNAIVSGIGGKLTGGDGANTGLIQQFAKDGKWYVTPTVGEKAGQKTGFTDQNEAIAFYIRESLKGLIGSGQLTGVNDDVKKALTTSKATKAEDLANDLGFAAGFRQQLDVMNASLDPTNNLLKTFTENAKAIGDQVKTNITDWRSKASELGLATETELTAAARKGIEAMMGLGPATKPLVGMAAATKQAEIEFEQFRPALVALGYTTGQVTDLATRYTKKLQDAYTDAVAYVQRQGAVAIESLINPNAKSSALDRLQGLGLDRTDSAIKGLAGVIDGVETAASAGLLTIGAERDALGRLNSALYDGTITADQYSAMVGYLTQAWSDSSDAAQRAVQKRQAGEDLTVQAVRLQGRGEEADSLELQLQQQRQYAQAVADGYDAAYLAGLRYVQGLEREAAEKERAAARASYNADVSSRMYAALGNNRGAGLIALDAQQATALAAARAAGYDTTQLRLVQATERGAQAFQLAQQDLLDAYDREIAAKQEVVDSIQSGAIALLQAAQQFKDARAALREGDDSPLAPRQRIQEASDRFDAAYAVLQDSRSTDADKDTARQTLLQVGPTLVALEKAASGGTASVLFDKVDRVFAELGDTGGLSLDTATQDLQVAQDQLKELQRARADAASMGQRQLGSLSGLRDVMDQSFAVWQAALSPLQKLTGTTGTTPRYSAPASVQTAWDTLSATQQGGIAKAMGWDGQVDDAFNFWLGSSADRRSDFEARVLAAGGGASTPRYSAPADVQSGWDGLSGDKQGGIVRAMGWTGSIDQAFNAWLATDGGRASTFESYVRTIAGGATYQASADIMRAWDALSVDQQALATQMAGYTGGVDGGLNAWVKLGHQADFESAVRARAHAAGVPGFATGTLSTPPGAVWVGERGPELLWQGGGAAVASSADSLRIASAFDAAVSGISPPAPTVSFRRPNLDAGGAGVAELLEAVEGLRGEVRAIGRDALTQRARIGADAAALLARVEAATGDLPRKLANTRRAA